jgi:hypothetical protein
MSQTTLCKAASGTVSVLLLILFLDWTSVSGQVIQPPASGAYWGAWADPKPYSGSNPEIQAVADLETSLGQTFRIHLEYLSWTAISNAYTSGAWPTPELADDTAYNRTPLISHGCGDTDANVVLGLDDQIITNTALALKAYGRPVFYRWFWEMNLSPHFGDCNGGTGGPSGYIAAWQHIWTVFQQQGATNVTFVFNPGIGGGDGSAYYPGDAYVDWVAIDGYVRNGNPDFSQSRIATVFYTAPYVVSSGKPLMIGETAAPNIATFGAEIQQPYLQSVESEWPTSFPGFKAFVWFSAVGPADDWILDDSGGTAEFANMGFSSYFSPVVGGATSPDFTISVSPPSVTAPPGSIVQYTVTVTAVNGFTGTVTLSDAQTIMNGTVHLSNWPYSFSSRSVTLTSTTTSASLILSQKIGSRASPGFEISDTVTGTSGSLTHAAPTVTVTSQ